MTDTIGQQSLAYHESFPPGKLEITPTKSMESQLDLSLAYSPGVSRPCLEIQADSSNASKYTARGNLVGVISNGTAVLGLGNIGALASKPVMEGKAVFFKKFSGVDAFDIEVDETDVGRFCDIVASLEPTFGGINLEDIKAPECFEIEKILRERMGIPVFHDDQHGTAIVVVAAVLNSLKIVEKSIAEIRIVCNGAGAAAIACLDLLVSFGANKDNIVVCDRKGVIRSDRDPLTTHETKKCFATHRMVTNLKEALVDADLFIGLSAADAVNEEMAISMAKNPIIFAMANPTPEILPETVRKIRPDAIIATGRSDYPNQVNNVLCFPFIFRGAFDVAASEINEEMKIACARAIADLAQAETGKDVLSAYGLETLDFGPEYIIPKPLDRRLITAVAPAVALAAMNSGVAKRPLDNIEKYIEELGRYQSRSG